MERDNKTYVPITEKLTLTLEEASQLTNIGINNLDKIVKNPRNGLVLYVGRKKLIKRKALEKYIEETVEI